ncbi:MAG: tRNA pseudouridine(55) synthase TruB [Anaerolineae bacterium]
MADIRRITNQRRVGHAGTLDPLAAGVLIVCLGRATRMSEYLMDSKKTYRARIRLGVTTNTYDAQGEVVHEAPVTVERADVETVLERFRGEILQVPPMYSALKRDGEPLYRLARRGITVDRPARSVVIHRLEMTSWEPPELTVELICSRGTYVRSLAHDLGQELSCGAHLVGLLRLASGEFRLEDAVPVADVTAERLPDLILPLDAALRGHPALHLGPEATRAIRSGLPIPAAGDAQDGSLARAYGPDGTFLAVVAYQETDAIWAPRKVFHPL